MKPNVSIPGSSYVSLRKLLRPSGGNALYVVVGLTFLIFVWDSQAPHPLFKVLEILLLVAGLVVGWLGLPEGGRSYRQGMQYFLAAAFLISIIFSWWKIPHLDSTYLFVMLVMIASALYGARDALLLAGMITMLDLVDRRSPSGDTREIALVVALQAVLLVITALAVSHITNGQRQRILALREELELARSAPFAFGERQDPRLRASLGLAVSESEIDIESLEGIVQSILQRIKAYFRAHSVLLYQPYSDSSLTLRHAVSDGECPRPGQIVDIQSSILGRIFGRGIPCSWNLDDPHSQVTGKDIPYYSESHPVRNLAACPMRSGNLNLGLLIVDRTMPRPFTELELIHLEIFAIQLVELMQIGKRYLEQADQNMEYSLFYRAMTQLGQSLATPEVLEALANVSQEVVSSTHVLIALADEGGIAYEIAYCHGSEKLKGCRVRSQGRTWISWMMNSDSGPLLLRDVRSHLSKMPVAAPGEEVLPVRSVLMIPLVAKGRKLGVLFLGSTRVDYYQNWHMRILTSICQQAAANIENSLLHRRVENEAFSDGLTHLHNHRYFQERLKSECSRACRSGSHLSLLMIDIDHFKKINDTHGHRIGDMILQQIAGILSGTLRSEDVIARYGGEEFVVILTESNRKGALRMAERSRLAIERTTFCAEEQRIRVSISTGAATFPEDGVEPWELIEHADQALYAGKEQGRNRVVQYHSITTQSPQIRNVR